MGTFNTQINPDFLVPFDGLQKIYGGTERREYNISLDILQNRFADDTKHSELLSSGLSLSALQSIILAKVHDKSVPTEKIEPRPITDTLKIVRRKCYTYPWLGGLALCEIGSDEPVMTREHMVELARQDIFKNYHLPLGLTSNEGSLLEAYTRSRQSLSLMSLLKITFPEEGLQISEKTTVDLADPHQQRIRSESSETARGPVRGKLRKASLNMIKNVGLALARYPRDNM